MTSKELEKVLLSEVSLNNILESVNVFSNLHRYSGTPQAEKAVDYLESKLNEYGVNYECCKYTGLFSIPISSTLTVQGPGGKTYDALGCVLSGECENLTAPIYYDALSLEKNLTEVQQEERYKAFKGKIVLSWEGRASFAAVAKKAGALAMIHIWKDDNNLLHHSNIGPVWGTPTPGDCDTLTYLPAVTFRQKDAKEIISLCEKSEVSATLSVKMDTGLRESRMPIASIPGKSEKFVLLAGHYDSWYEGITGNAAADAIMLEIARVIHKYQEELGRSIRIAWWSGHSDGRFAGSTWYCDQFYENLKKHCVAYINMDICGCKNTGKIIARTTLMEGMDFTADIIEDMTGIRPNKYVTMVKGADQSFWGINVPIAIMAKNEPLPGNETLYGKFTNPGGGPWWHSVEDTIDKLDTDAVLRDYTFNTRVIASVLNAETLPVDIPGFLDEMKKQLKEISDSSDHNDFCLDPVFDKITSLKPLAVKFGQKIRTMPKDLSDELIKETAGKLVRVTYSMVDEYHFEPALSSAFAGSKSTFTGLRIGMNRNRENTKPQSYLFAQTEFIRQRNRLKDVLSQVEYIMKKYIEEES